MFYLKKKFNALKTWFLNRLKAVDVSNFLVIFFLTIGTVLLLLIGFHNAGVYAKKRAEESALRRAQRRLQKKKRS